MRQRIQIAVKVGIELSSSTQSQKIELIVYLPEADDNRLHEVSQTLFDGSVTPREMGAAPATLTIDSLESLAVALDPESGLTIDGVEAETVFVDFEALDSELSPALVGLGALCARWSGGRLVVSVPETSAHNTLAAVCDLLRSLEARAKGVRIISCPTCARCHTHLVGLVKELEPEIKRHQATLDVALMGCEVNGPGEAKAADVGVAFGKGIGLLFRGGEIIKRVPEDEVGQALLDELASMTRGE